jgi:hypothetical protein
MGRIGWLLTIFGVGTFVLPFLGLEFKVMRLFGDAAPIAAAIMAVVGIVLLVMARRNKAPQ